MKSKSSSQNNARSSANGAGFGSEKSTTCIISKGTRVEGQFVSQENVRLDGVIKGEVKCESRLVMGESGKIEGKVRTKDADIHGTIEGEITVFGSLQLRSTARIHGNITATSMSVEEGASWTGECKVGQTATQQKKQKGTAVAA
ncbi:MAG: polymer-forming cytoskeletal protein [Saprospiraceae bacterium]